MSPNIRASRGLRKRVEKKNAPRAARSIDVDNKGLIIEGKRFPFLVGPELDVDQYRSIAGVTMTVYTDRFRIAEPLRRGRVTQTYY